MSDRRKKSRPKAARSRRYTANEKEKILRVVDRHGINSAREKFGVSLWSLYRWRRDRELSRSARDPGGKTGLKHVAKPPRVRVPKATQDKVLAVWRNNPGFGPSQVHYQLRRVGVSCDTKTIRKILTAHGYSPPSKRAPRSKDEERRFEAERPLELVQMDVLKFYVHAQQVYLFLMLDDHSRFITGWDLLQRETMEDAMDLVEDSIRRYGKPEEILTDRGATFHAWNGISRFDRMLESYDIDHTLAAPRHPKTCGKVEAVNKAIQKELIDRVEFRNFLDAKEQIGRWVDGFNHHRVHQGIGGVLVPADRFYGRADQVLERIEKGLSGNGVETNDDASKREVSLFQVRLTGDIIELWLFGKLVAKLQSRADAS